MAQFVVDGGDHVGGEVDDLLEILRRQVEQVAQPARHTLEVPDVGDRGGQLDVAHALAADLGLVTSTPQRSQMMPLKRTRLYLPQ